LPRPPIDRDRRPGCHDEVIAVAAVERELDLAGRIADAFDGVVAGKPVDHELVIGIEVRDRHGLGKACHRDNAVVVGDLDRVIAMVALTITVSRSRRRRCPRRAARSIATCVTPVPVRSLTVMVSAPPGH
jgi:hypothetical protein